MSIETNLERIANALEKIAESASNGAQASTGGTGGGKTTNTSSTSSKSSNTKASSNKSSAKDEEKGSASKPSKSAGFWQTPNGRAHGEFSSVEEFQEAEAKHGVIKEISKAAYTKLAGSDDEGADEAKTEGKADSEDTGADDSAAAEEPSEDDLIETFKKYLHSDLDKDERAERQGKVRPFLQKKKVKKATELPASDRAEAIKFIEGLLAELESEGGSDDDGLV